MALSGMFDSGWLYRAPALDEIVSEIRDERRGRKKIAVVIPNYKNPSILHTHLSRLSAQTFKDFDVITVLGQDDRPPEGGFGFSSLYLRRKLDIGSAGAFYAGERRAFEDGYEVIVLADDDCLPESADLLETLVSGVRKNKVAKAKLLVSSARLRPRVLAQYGAVSRDVFERCGFSFLPFYSGAEDVELEMRMRSQGIETEHIVGGIASHPITPSFLFWPRYKLYHYFRNAGLFFSQTGSVLFMNLTVLCQLLLAAGLASIGRYDAGFMILRALFGICTAGYFKGGFSERGGMIATEAKRIEDGAVPPARRPPEYIEMDIPCGFLLPSRKKRAEGPRWKALLAYSRDVVRQIAALAGNFGKRIAYPEMQDDLGLLAILFSRSAWGYHRDRPHYIVKDRCLPAITFGLALFVLLSVPSIILTPFLSCIAMAMHRMRGISTDRYGL